MTPPPGHPLCGGWIEPVRGVDDPLRARRRPARRRAPVVLCAVDWCGIRNDAHLAWRQALAEAAHTVRRSNVAVQCVHPHNAPFADTGAEKLIETAPSAPPSLDLKFFDRAVRDDRRRGQGGAGEDHPVHPLSASAGPRSSRWRRTAASSDRTARWKATRYSATKDPKVRDEPEGLIDPWLKTLSFWDGDTAAAPPCTTTPRTR